ncbi:hypothetical protein SELMODRAFT_411330 [Selaginella moellendorffii]|uniref:Uncharacterized protein RPD1L2-2 n=1 Tax=Selaginella moellendorffii TaxID=88036 RepID=D8RHB0_SELML|nr:protein WHAT'S THIS FACTOR 1 [Selaginella moellendorffii]EFJ28498.1 hypothetical protein SELMODRAFT_411330 [Selaginella moellendorffii]|eukprot:XP_002970368.1 protein WHAT'S THIS FACTOR 1 [Selaginella moellendorffii]
MLVIWKKSQNADALASSLWRRECGNPWVIQRRFMARERKRKRIRQVSFDVMISREKHVRQALWLKDLLVTRPGHTISMIDFREEVKNLGMRVRRLYYLLEYYDTLFQTRVDRAKVEWIELGEDGRRIVELERRLMAEYEPCLVENLRKLLMMSEGEKICLKRIALLREPLGLPHDFEQNLVHKYPQYFDVVIAKDKKYRDLQPFLKLTSWDPLLAISRREADAEESERDPHSFRMRFPGVKFVRGRDAQFLKSFQMLEFPSPYDPNHGYPKLSREAVKRAVAVIHEFLCLTQESKALVDSIAEIRRETGIPKKIGELICRHPGIFYLSWKGALARHPHMEVVYLKEAYSKPYEGERLKAARLLRKGPLVQVKEAMALTMWHADLAYDKRHGTDCFLEGRQFPMITYDAFESTFQSELYREQKIKYENL